MSIHASKICIRKAGIGFRAIPNPFISLPRSSPTRVFHPPHKLHVDKTKVFTLDHRRYANDTRLRTVQPPSPPRFPAIAFSTVGEESSGALFIIGNNGGVECNLAGGS